MTTTVRITEVYGKPVQVTVFDRVGRTLTAVTLLPGTASLPETTISIHGGQYIVVREA